MSRTTGSAVRGLDKARLIRSQARSIRCSTLAHCEKTDGCSSTQQPENRSETRHYDTDVPRGFLHSPRVTWHGLNQDWCVNRTFACRPASSRKTSPSLHRISHSLCATFYLLLTHPQHCSLTFARSLVKPRQRCFTPWRSLAEDARKSPKEGIAT